MCIRERINIKELSERAMINRKTFYLHYDSLDGLLGKMQSELYMEIIKSVSGIKLPQDLEKLTRALFMFWANTDGINEKILLSQGNFPIGKSPGDYAMKKLFHYQYPGGNSLNCHKYEANIIDSYLCGSFISIYTQWAADGKKIPLENIIQISTKLISQGLCVFGMPDGTEY